jgi:hypothetical protein
LNAQAYGLISYGRDGAISAVSCSTTTNFNDDIIYSNGGFVQFPQGAQN